MKVLIPIDGSENSRLALSEIARRKWNEGDEVKIIHIVESPIPVTDMMGVNAEINRDIHNENVDKGRKMLNEAEKTLNDESESLKVTSEVITAQPFHSAAQEIVNQAGSESADLVVMGSRGMNKWKTLFLGSVSQAVIQHAPCSVAIVRPKQIVAETVD